MIAARDSEGNRLFTSAEFLTSQQVASFFSRLAAKRRLPDVTSGSDEEADDAETESALHWRAQQRSYARGIIGASNSLRLLQHMWSN